MSDAQVAIPQSQYVDFWNDVLVPKFVRWRHVIVGGLTLHSAKVFPSLKVMPEDKVVDAGCGFGDTAIELARLVGPSGSVLGVDCCDGFLAYGRADAKKLGIANVTFLQADVQTYPFTPTHDFCFSRFGTQFFENPVAGLRNMRRGIIRGLASPKTLYCVTCRHPERTRGPAVPDRFPWQTPASSPNSWRLPATATSNSNGSTPRCSSARMWTTLSLFSWR
jgi:SAM-dependent methyltransferase